MKDYFELVIFEADKTAHISLGNVKNFQRVGLTYFSTFGIKIKWNYFAHILKFNNKDIECFTLRNWEGNRRHNMWDYKYSSIYEKHKNSKSFYLLQNKIN